MSSPDPRAKQGVVDFFGLRWDDPDIAIKWPIEPAALTISPKDRALPPFRAFQSPFTA